MPLKQVYAGVATFGTTYSSTELYFGGNSEKEIEDAEEKKEETEDKSKM